MAYIDFAIGILLICWSINGTRRRSRKSKQT